MRVREPRSRGRVQPGEHAASARQGDAHAGALRGVAAVCDHGFEHAVASSERAELQAMHDPSRDADQHDDADLHPDRDAAGVREAVS